MWNSCLQSDKVMPINDSTPKESNWACIILQNIYTWVFENSLSICRLGNCRFRKSLGLVYHNKLDKCRVVKLFGTRLSFYIQCMNYKQETFFF